MASAVRSDEQFLCSVCLEVFTDPVSTPCGHNFCKTCLSQAWGSAPFRCPLCNKSFDTRPELNMNMFIKEMVSQFKLERSDPMKRLVNLSEESRPASVLCDICADPKLKALKSCLVCLASYCETHLQPHLTVSGLRTHQLMEPVEDMEDRMCPTHHRPLELFCRSDQNSVCVICSVSEHKNHDIVSVKEAYGEQKASLQQTQAQTHLMVEQRRLKVQEISRSLELSQEAVDRERTSGLQAFSTLVQSVQRRQQKFIEELQEQHKLTQEQALDLISELEQEISELEKTSSEVDQLSLSEDHFHFIQRYTSLRPAADRKDMKDTKDWSMVSFDPQTYEGTAARVLAELEESLTEEFKKLSASLELHKLQKFVVDVTLNPDTAHPHLVLSEDLKQVHHTGVKKDLPYSPLRFSNHARVLSKQSFSSGRFYFEVQVKGKTEWNLGVAQESCIRKGEFITSPKNGFWTIWLINEDGYEAYTDHPVRLSPVRPPQKVGVFVDYSAGLVSFYDVDSADLLYSFTGCTFKGRLCPHLGPCNNDGGRNSTPLVIRKI